MTGKPIPKPTHTLTAVDGFGNVLFTQTNEEGAALRLSAPTLDGYTFTGWTFATAGGTDLGQLAIMPACDVTGHRPMDANRHARTGLYPLYGFWL